MYGSNPGPGLGGVGLVGGALPMVGVGFDVVGLAIVAFTMMTIGLLLVRGSTCKRTPRFPYRGQA